MPICVSDHILASVMYLTVAKVSSLGQGGCDKGQFACGQNDICIPQSWLCDGVSDCIQEEDEQPWICEWSEFTVIGI